MRLTRDGGKTYKRRYERQITAELPALPAAVLIYSTDGCARTICIDLDVSRGGRDGVNADLRRISGLLEAAGTAWFADRSPSGGVHVYVPLQTPLPYPEARTAAQRLAVAFATVDPMPMYGLTDGCIRPPGSAHRLGGHQQLIGSLPAAEHAALERTSDAAWSRFLDRLPVLTSSPAGELAESLESLEPRGRFAEPDASYQQIARTGDYSPARYTSPSEARQAVVWACVAAGWELTDVHRRLLDGTWPGLASMYARYAPHARAGAVKRDWRKAIAFERQRRGVQKQSVHIGTTSERKTHPPTSGDSVYRRVREWRSGVEARFREGRKDALAERAVLLALAEAAMKTGSLEVEFGNRSLAVATGLDQATVGKILCRLRAEEDPFVDLVDEASGVRAHLYALRMPESVKDYASARPWGKGKIHAVRPAFRELGLAAAFVYAVLESSRVELSVRAVSERAHVGVSTAHEALLTLSAFDLARRGARGWRLGGGDVQVLAEQFGVVEQVAAQLARHRRERRQYWVYLGVIDPRDLEVPSSSLQSTASGPLSEESLFELLQTMFNATPIDTC